VLGEALVELAIVGHVLEKGRVVVEALLLRGLHWAVHREALGGGG
jgi:hypothetical protein